MVDRARSQLRQGVHGRGPVRHVTERRSAEERHQDNTQYYGRGEGCLHHFSHASS